MSTSGPSSDGKKQQQMKQQIRSYLRKKDYYDILGLTKTCTQPDIKKAYKKLALRFHPDKNNVQGSKQVFKKVSNAYSNLIDSEKRATYDRYGPQQDRQPQYRPQRHYRQGYSQEDEFQDIFRAFFGGMQTRHNGYHHNGYQNFTFNMGGHAHNNQNQQRQGGINLMYLLGIFFLLYILPALFSTKSQPIYSLMASPSYRFKMSTSKLANTFYVKQQYFQKNKNNQLTKQVQLKVDTQYVNKYRTQCGYLQAGYGAYQNVRATWRQSCNKLASFRQKHPAYYRQVIYGY